MSEADNGPPPLEAVDDRSGAASSVPPPEKKKRAASTQKKAVSSGRKKKKAEVVPEPPNVVNRSLTKKLYCILCHKGAASANARWGFCRSCQIKMGTVKDQ